MNNMISLAVSNDRKNKTRSILTIICILLTSMMLTIIAAFCNGALMMNVINGEMMYGRYHGVYRDLNMEQVQEVQRRSEIAEIGKMSFAGEVNAEKNLMIAAADSDYRQMTGAEKNLQEGSFPQAKNEITAQREFFEFLGYENPRIGDQVILSSRIDKSVTYTEKEMIISGFLKENPTDIKQESWAGFVSEAFYNNAAKEGSRSYSVYFCLNDTGLNGDLAKELIKEIAGQYQITERQVKINTGYLISSFDLGTDTIFAGVVAGLCVVIFSSLVIYNIFQAGLVQKIQEYGKLKALGATRKQIKRVVRTEGLLLSLIGIPGGILLGSIISQPLMRGILKQVEKQYYFDGMTMPDVLNPSILLGVAAISLLTVLIALAKPVRIVSKLSPMEAVRYQENTISKKSRRKGFETMGVRQITMASMSMNKKRTISTILTMGLSCVLFVIITSFVSNIDVHYDTRMQVEMGRFKISLDYSLNDKAYPENNLDQVLLRNPLGDEFIDRIKQIQGVTEVVTSKVVVVDTGSSEQGEERKMTSAAVLNKEQMELFETLGSNEGDFNYDTAAEEDLIFFGWNNFLDDYGYAYGKPMQVKLSDGSNEKILNTAIQGAFGSFTNDWAITEATYEKLGFGKGNTGYVWVDCKQEDVSRVEKEINDIMADYKNLELKTYEETLKITKNGTFFIQMVSYVLLGVLGTIGFMNMANTIIMNIITRKQELGVLQAIGMTNRQLNLMLQMEGLLSSMGTVIISLLLGLPIGYALFLYGRESGWIGLNIYHFPVAEISVMLGFIAGLQMGLSFVLSRNIRKETLVERIRYQQ